jgi:hypothetical protein
MIYASEQEFATYGLADFSDLVTMTLVECPPAA